MATLYVTEFAAMGRDAGTAMPVGFGAFIANQTVAITGGSTQSATFNPNTKLIRLECDAICSIMLGVNPTATNTTARMFTNQTEYFAVPPDGTFSVAVISNI